MGVLSRNHENASGYWWEQICGIPYAYIILVTGALGDAMSGPGQTPTVGAVLPDLMSSLDLDRSRISMIFGLATLTGAAVLPLVGGPLYDRAGARVTIAVAQCGLGLSCLLMTTVSSSGGLLVSLFLLRFFGQGLTMLASGTTVNLWWVARRGQAIGAAAIPQQLGLGFFWPTFILHMKAVGGWRWAYAATSGMCFGAAGVLGAAYRARPEQYGMLPDGRLPSRGALDPAPEAAPTGPAGALQTADQSWSAHDALHSMSFYVYAVNITATTGMFIALLFHMVGVVDEVVGHPVSKDHLARVYLTISLVGLAVKMSTAGLLDGPMSPKACLCLAMVALSCGSAVLALGCAADTALAGVSPSRGARWGLLYAGAVLASTAMGLATNLQRYVYATFFGRRDLARISSVAQGMWQVSSAVMPVAVGMGQAWCRSFAGPFAVGAAAPLALVLVAITFGDNPNGKRGPGHKANDGGEDGALADELEMKNLLKSETE